jgi:hypothetical protein
VVRCCPQAISEEKSLQKFLSDTKRMISTLDISVLKLLFFVDLQLKLGELVLWIPFCASVIIWENALNLFIEKLWLWQL